MIGSGISRWFDLSWSAASLAGSASIRPFDKVGLVPRVLPFAAVATFALLVDVADPQQQVTAAAAGAAGLIALAIGLAIFLPWARLPSWLDVVPPLAFVVAAMLVRHSSGGAEGGVLTLFALPLVWTALYGDRGQVIAVTGAIFVVNALPLIVIGAPAYPPDEWQRVAINGSVAVLISGVVHGLTQRIRRAAAEQAERSTELAASEERLKAVLGNAHDAIVTLDTQGRIRAVNPAAERMFRGTPAELIGRDLIETMATDEERDFLRLGMAKLAIGAVESARRNFGAELRRLDGETFPAEVSVGVVVEGTETIVHAFARDVTDRKHAEAAARQHVLDLDALLAATRTFTTAADPVALRSAICAAALDLSRGDVAALLEPDGVDLSITAAVGLPVPVASVPLHGVASASATVFHTRRPHFSGRLRADPRVARDLATQTGVDAGYWQPVLGRDGIVGVLAVCWVEPMAELHPRTRSVLELLAGQAGVAIEMATLVGRLGALARVDGLTAIANRRTFDETIGLEVARAGRSDRPLSLVMLDMDHFKAYNDRLGHQAGDRLLMAAAAAWQDELRPNDLLARYGGEEFAVLLPDCTVEAALRVADRLRARVPDGQTVSAGVSTWEPAETPGELIARADAALYLAKAAGRDRSIAV